MSGIGFDAKPSPRQRECEKVDRFGVKRERANRLYDVEDDVDRPRVVGVARIEVERDRLAHRTDVAAEPSDRLIRRLAMRLTATESIRTAAARRIGPPYFTG